MHLPANWHKIITFFPQYVFWEGNDNKMTNKVYFLHVARKSSSYFVYIWS